MFENGKGIEHSAPPLAAYHCARLLAKKKEKRTTPYQHLCSAPPLKYVKLGRFMGEIIVTLQTPDGGILESTQMEQAFLAMRKATLPRRRP
jgi:hypothetical protein